MAASAHGSRGDGSAAEADPAERDADFEARWNVGGFTYLGGYSDFLLNAASNETAAEFVRHKIAATVHDPETAALLMPSHVIGCKRLCFDSGYYETFNRPNVSLVDVSRQPIEEITPTGVRVGGVDYEVDAIVYATGFDAMTGSLLKINACGPRSRCRRRGKPGRARTWAWQCTVCRTCSPSAAPAARRCSPT